MSSVCSVCGQSVPLAGTAFKKHRGAGWKGIWGWIWGWNCSGSDLTPDETKMLREKWL